MPGELLDDAAGALVWLLGAFRKHRAALLVDEIDIEPLLGLLDHNVLGRFGKLRHVLQRLAERGGGEREGLVVLQVRAVLALVVLFVGGRRRRSVFGINIGSVAPFGRVGKPSTSITPE